MSDPTAGAPQPQNITITTNLDTEPAHAEQLGHICVNWANLEWNLYLLYEKMSGSPPAVARSAFYSVESNRGRRDMLTALVGLLFNKESEVSIFDDIMRRVAKTAGARNKYVHDTWGVAQTQKHEIFQMRMSSIGDEGIMQQVTIPDMKDTAAHIRKLAGELFDFRERIMPKLPALLEKYRKLPGLGLQFSPKGHPPGRLPKGHHGPR